MTLQFLNAEKQINDMLVFPNFNLSIEKGQVVAIYTNLNVREQIIELLIGKSTLSKGEIRLNEKELSMNHQEIGFLFLNDYLYERLTVEEMLVFTKRLFLSNYSIDSAMSKLQIESKRKVKLRKLSFSERRRVQLACLLIQDTSIFVLEEPDQNLDLESKRIYLSLLDEFRMKDKATLIITNNMESAITASDKVYRLDNHGLVSVETESPEGTNEMNPTDTPAEVKPVSFEKIPSKVNEKIVLFHPLEIDYIESVDGQSQMHVNNESFPCVFTLQKLEERLLPFGFFRCHRSYIVNLQKVREVITWTRNSYSLVLEDARKSTIPLSKSKMTELKDMLGI